MKKLILMLALGMVITFVNAQDTTKKKGNTPVKPATPQNNTKRTPVKPADLLKPISDYITENFKDYKTINAFKVVKGDDTKYEVNLQKGTEKEKLVFDADGNFVKKITPVVKPQTTKSASGSSNSTPSTAPTTPAPTGTTTTPDDQKK